MNVTWLKKMVSEFLFYEERQPIHQALASNSIEIKVFDNEDTVRCVLTCGYNGEKFNALHVNNALDSNSTVNDVVHSLVDKMSDEGTGNWSMHAHYDHDYDGYGNRSEWAKRIMKMKKRWDA